CVRTWGSYNTWSDLHTGLAYFDYW
nr:immunoglobulin heavy chain junction region [Macaca mulatta]